MSYVKQIAIQAALDAWAMSGDIYKAEHVEHLIDLDAIIASVKKPEPVGYQFKGINGKWHHFMSEGGYEAIKKNKEISTRHIYAEPVSSEPVNARLLDAAKNVVSSTMENGISLEMCDVIDSLIEAIAAAEKGAKE